MNKLFVDTSAWIAHFNSNDDFHSAAEKLFLQRPELATSNAVLHETIAHLASRVNKKAAIVAGEFILETGVVELITLSLQDEQKSWNKLKQINFQMSFVDISNVIVMKANDLTDIFSFDSDFTKLNLNVVPTI